MGMVVVLSHISQPEVPYGIPDTSEPLSPNFFINPRCPLSVVPVEAAAVLEENISEAGEHLSSAKVGRVGNLMSLA